MPGVQGKMLERGGSFDDATEPMIAIVSIRRFQRYKYDFGTREERGYQRIYKNVVEVGCDAVLDIISDLLVILVTLSSRVEI